MELRRSSASYPEGNFGGNQLQDGSIGLSPLHPVPTINLHVRGALDFHQSFLWLHPDRAWITIFLAEQKRADQLEHTYSSYVRIRDVALKTCRRLWTIGRSGERGSGRYVLAARHDDDDGILSDGKQHPVHIIVCGVVPSDGDYMPPFTAHTG